MNLLEIEILHRCPKHDRPYADIVEIGNNAVFIKYTCGCGLTFMKGEAK